MTKRLLWAPCLIAIPTFAALLWTSNPPVESAKTKSLRPLMPDSPIAAAQFRYQQRLSEDGKIPENAFAHAMQQREAILAAQPPLPKNLSGPYPGGWTWLGPGNIGGRVREILIDPTNPNTMWTGGASGGIWKTTNGGALWAPMDDFMPTLAIGCMAL